MRALILTLLFTTALLAQPIAFTHVTVIDVSNGAARPAMTVVFDGDRITAVGAGAAVPQGARVIDATGKFLIPGLWDMHVHGASDKDVFIPLFLANGVTGVRSMFDPWDQIVERRKEMAAGNLIAPCIFASGPIVDGPHPIWPGSVAVGTAEEGRAAVRKLKSAGSDFIKVYSLLPRDAYFAIADESKKQAIPFAGHVPNSVTPAEASNAGQKSIEHLTGIALYCSSHEGELTRQMQEGMSKDAASAFAAFLRINAKAADSYDSAKAAVLYLRFARNRTWQTPTLSVLHAFAYATDPSVTEDPRLKYMPNGLRQFWKTSPTGAIFTAEDYRAQQHAFGLDLQIVAEMKKAGVQFLAGTDTPNPYVFPGFSLHDELELLVKAGLSPLEALQAATLRPAEYFGITDKLGTIAPGHFADLVLLNANPLEAIGNTRKIEAVVAAGHLLTRADLDKSLAMIAAGAKSGAAPVPPGSENGLVSDFEQTQPESKFGSGWMVSTDAYAGGKSTATLAIAPEGAEGSKGSLLIEGEVMAGLPFAWAGAMFLPGPALMQPANLSAKTKIGFWAKGEGRPYQVMFFSESHGYAPAMKTITVGPEWEHFAFPLSAFTGIDSHDITGVFFGAGPKPGKFKLQIDNVRFE